MYGLYTKKIGIKSCHIQLWTGTKRSECALWMECIVCFIFRIGITVISIPLWHNVVFCHSFVFCSALGTVYKIHDTHTLWVACLLAARFWHFSSVQFKHPFEEHQQLFAYIHLAAAKRNFAHYFCYNSSTKKVFYSYLKCFFVSQRWNSILIEHIWTSILRSTIIRDDNGFNSSVLVFSVIWTHISSWQPFLSKHFFLLYLS